VNNFIPPKTLNDALWQTETAFFALATVLSFAQKTMDNKKAVGAL
jgi:IS4 transposase